MCILVLSSLFFYCPSFNKRGLEWLWDFWPHQKNPSLCINEIQRSQKQEHLPEVQTNKTQTSTEYRGERDDGETSTSPELWAICAVSPPRQGGTYGNRNTHCHFTLFKTQSFSCESGGKLPRGAGGFRTLALCLTDIKDQCKQSIKILISLTAEVTAARKVLSATPV